MFPFVPPKTKKKRNDQIQEYLYIEDIPLLPLKEEEIAKEKDTDRGIVIIQF